MSDWYIVFSDLQPADFDFSSSPSTVYQHRNAQLVIIDDSQQWQYEERKLSHTEFIELRLQQLQDENTQTQLALAELYESLLEV